MCSAVGEEMINSCVYHWKGSAVTLAVEKFFFVCVQL